MMRMKNLFVPWAVLSLLLLLAAPALAAPYGKFWAQVQDEYGNPITSGCQVYVYTTDSKTLATIYSTANGTSKTNPVTTTQFATDAQVVFYQAAGNTYDVMVLTNDGDQAWLNDFSEYTHRIVIPKYQGAFKKVTIPFALPTDASQVRTSVNLPMGCAVYDVLVEVVTNASRTMNIGLYGGDTDGFAAAVSVATAGVPKMATGNATTYGALLTGADQSGSNVRVPYYVGTSTLEVAYEGADTGTAAAGYLHFFVMKLR